MDDFTNRTRDFGGEGSTEIEAALCNLSFGFISFVCRDLSPSSRAFYLGNGAAAIPLGKNPENLEEISSENEGDKPKTQVYTNLYFYKILINIIIMN